MARKKTVDVAVIIPDASPILTLARIDRLDLLSTFAVPIKIVDQVHYEITKPANDPYGRVDACLQRLGNQIEIIQTAVGLGFRTMREKNPDTPSRNLGEIAVDEFATELDRSTGPSFIPLVLFEDPDVLELRVARLKGVHLLNTTGWLLALSRSGHLTDGQLLIDTINASRASPMVPIDRPAKTKKLRSTWIRRSHNDAE
jgi:hypothetical protein